MLQKGTNSVDVRPYRYLQSPENEIERLIKDMLKGELFNYTQVYSPVQCFWSKRKTISGVYVDYRALNKVTIPEKFPIPVIDQFLDKLRGAVVFIKSRAIIKLE